MITRADPAGLMTSPKPVSVFQLKLQERDEEIRRRSVPTRR